MRTRSVSLRGRVQQPFWSSQNAKRVMVSPGPSVEADRLMLTDEPKTQQYSLNLGHI